jgi:prepilin-type N-terminal cleavage/methylation domain-containing protein
MKKRYEPDGGCAGFSLLELLTVLLMLGVLAGIVGPAIGKFMAGLEFRKQVGGIMANIRAVRLQAIVSGREIKMSLQDNDLLLDMGREEQEVKELDLDAESELSLEPELVIFTPQATATPAALSLTVGSRSRTINLDPLTALPVIR